MFVVLQCFEDVVWKNDVSLKKCAKYIASLSGIDISTVTLAINNHAEVNIATIQSQVLKLIEKFDQWKNDRLASVVCN